MTDTTSTTPNPIVNRLRPLVDNRTLIYVFIIVFSAIVALAARPRHAQSLGEQWQNAERQMVRAFLEGGDVVGAARAEDFIYRMSHGQAGTPMPSLEALPETAAPLPAPAPVAPAPQIDPWGGFDPPTVTVPPPITCTTMNLGSGMTTTSCQ